MAHTVAITGATGFIGGAVADALVKSGYHVRALVRKSTPQTRLLQCIVGDLDDVHGLSSFLRGADTLIHCAGLVRGVRAAEFTHVNDTATGRLTALAARESHIRQFILMSSLAASRPEISPYAASKHGGEQAMQRQAATLEWTILRPSAVYGPGDKALGPLFRAMQHGIAPLWADSPARFSLLHVSDLVTAVMACLHEPKLASAIYELHDGHAGGYSMDEVIATASGVLGKRIRPIRIPAWLLGAFAAVNTAGARVLPYQPMLTRWKLAELRHPQWVCDNSAFTNASGWRPTVSLSRGLSALLANSSACRPSA